MCGFYGAFSLNGVAPIERASLAHRGPDADGDWSDGFLYVKHFRLSILGGPTARQPMHSRSGRYLIAFNGEVFNYKELAAELGSEDLIPQGDTRVLLELIDRYGMTEIGRLNGMFAFMVYDTIERSLWFVRDRLGIKPLYYRVSNNTVHFASEIKALPGDKVLAPIAVSEYLRYGAYPPVDETFFRDVFQFKPSCVSRWSGSAVTYRPYYDLADRLAQGEGTVRSTEEYEALVGDAIRLRLRSDVPVSLHFSGGTDSTALLLKTKEVWGWDYPLTTYTTSFTDPRFDEARICVPYAEALGVGHREVLVTPEEIPDLARRLQYYQDEPFGGVPTIAYFKMNLVEKSDGYSVSLEGQGGDEALGGYPSHVLMTIKDLIESGEDQALCDRLLTLSGMSRARALDVADRYIASGFAAHVDLTDFRNRLKPMERHGSWLRSIQLHDILNAKIPRTLRFNDRASAGVGREVRFPLLDYRVLEYGLALDAPTRFKGGVVKAPLLEIVQRYLGDTYSTRKRTVVTPQTDWLAGPLRDWGADLTRCLERRGVVEADFGRALAFYDGAQVDNSFFAWQLINLELLVSAGALIDQPVAGA